MSKFDHPKFSLPNISHLSKLEQPTIQSEFSRSSNKMNKSVNKSFVGNSLA